jgi:WD40 repeat protein
LFSPNGKILALLEDGSISLWSVPTGKLLWEARGKETGYPEGVFTPDSLRFLSWGLDHGACFRDAGTGAILHRHPLLPADREHFYVGSPDGKVLAGLIDPYSVCLWEASTGKKLHTLPRRGWPVSVVTLSPGGRIVLTADVSSKAVQFWEAETGRDIPLGHSEAIQVFSLSFTPRGERVGSLNSGSTRLFLWDPITGKQVRAFRWKGTIHAFAFSPDGTRVALGQDRHIQIFDLATAKLLARAPGGVKGEGRLIFSADGKTLAGQDSLAVRFWDAATGAELPGPEGHTDVVCRLVFS